MRDPKTILITGASSGIGAALARLYAAEGVTLVLTGRDLDRLDAVAAACRDDGATVRHATVDVTDSAFLTRWLVEVDSATPIDLVIANAGVSGGGGGKDGAVGEPADQVRRLFAINVDGVLDTVLPIVDRMVERARRRKEDGLGDGPHGQIALMSSLASFRGFPGAPAYAATKAAVRVWGEGLRPALAPHGVAVSVICPGFVKSPMTARNPYRMPFLMEADKAARIIRRGLARNRGRIAFPWPTYWMVLLLAALPPALVDRLLKRTPAKPALDPRADAAGSGPGTAGGRPDAPDR
ncbi:MAG: SDR family NAD(P)-dependent oxidoreductase [Azospirillaceae bacterium]